MNDLFFPVSTTTLSQSPVIDITEENFGSLYVVTIDSSGFISKTLLSILADSIKPTTLSVFSDIIGSNSILGRYSPGIGGLEEIILGDGFSIANGILSCSLAISGEAGGDLEGTYPSPTLKDGVITLSKFSGLSSNKLLGRYSSGSGGLEEITLSDNFEIANGQLSLLNTNNISQTGFIINQMDSSFSVSPTNLYFVNSQVNVVVTVGPGALGDQFIIINRGPGEIIIDFPNETITMNPFSGKRIGYFVCDGDNNYYDIS